jgi:OOP family OmpA-OmpF porin
LFVEKETAMRITTLFVRVGLPTVLLLGWIGAAQADRPGIYLGGAWGGYRINESDIHDNDNMLRAFAGLQFSNWFGIEGQWADFNRLNNANGSSFDADGKGLAAVISFPFSETSSLFIKGGQFWWESDSTIGGTLGDKDGNDPFYGAGFKLGFAKHAALRLEYERYDVSHVKLDAATVGLQFNF